MTKLLILIFILPLLVFGQPINTPTKAYLTKAYCQVITEYIKAVSKSDTLHFDTLFIGKHEEFPDIELPTSIYNKKIILMTYNKFDKEPQNNKSFVLINIIESKFTKDDADFMLVTFHKGYHPQHNCYIDLKYNLKKKNLNWAKK